MSDELRRAYDRHAAMRHRNAHRQQMEHEAKVASAIRRGLSNVESCIALFRQIGLKPYPCYIDGELPGTVEYVYNRTLWGTRKKVAYGRGLWRDSIRSVTYMPNPPAYHGWIVKPATLDNEDNGTYNWDGVALLTTGAFATIAHGGSEPHASDIAAKQERGEDFPLHLRDVSPTAHAWVLSNTELVAAIVRGYARQAEYASGYRGYPSVLGLPHVEHYPGSGMRQIEWMVP